MRDPRVSEQNNSVFLDLMESYFGVSDGVRDARPEVHYQVGVTPEFTEKARDHCGKIGAYSEGNKPLTVCPPEYDAKWRFFWRIGPRPEVTRYPAMNMTDVVPEEFPQWTQVMDTWGGLMLGAVFTLAEMAATGFGLPATTFTDRMQFGPHLLAPTGSDFSKFGNKVK